jgi:hypothetical protein
MLAFAVCDALPLPSRRQLGDEAGLLEYRVAVNQSPGDRKDEDGSSGARQTRHRAS